MERFVSIFSIDISSQKWNSWGRGKGRVGTSNLLIAAMTEVVGVKSCVTTITEYPKSRKRRKKVSRRCNHFLNL